MAAFLGTAFLVPSVASSSTLQWPYSVSWLTQWGAPVNGSFSSPQGLAVDSSGKIYVSDTYDNRIQKFDSSFTYVTQ